MENSDIKKEKVVLRGMEGVEAAETSISFVDGENGDLFYQGYNIHHLAEKVCHDEVIYLLWFGDLPTKKQLDKFRARLLSEMTLPKKVISWIRSVPRKTHPMDVLRTAVSMLGPYDPDQENNSTEANVKKAIRITAQVPTIIAWLYRSRMKEKPEEPDPERSIAHNFMRMFLGRELYNEEVVAAELLMILHADHGMNASTFAARVTASTLADMYAAITSALGTLKGPLHGGANQRVMEMLEDIKRPDMVDEYIDGLLKEGKRIMGFGHRVYKTEDPRASHLRRWSETLCSRRKSLELYHLSHLIEKKVRKNKHIHPNVDFYSATVQHAMGIPKDYYTSMFAASRVAGWTAHVMEQHENNRLIRPTSKYVGQYGRRFVPIARRKEEQHKEHINERSQAFLSSD